MGGITFLDYVKDLPKGKREAKISSKSGQAKAAPPAAAPSQPPAEPSAANGTPAPESASTSRALPEAPQADTGDVAALAKEIVDKVRRRVL